MIPDTRARVRRFPLAFARIRRLPLAFARVRRFPIVLARMPRLLLAFTGMRRLPLVLAALLATFAAGHAAAQVQPCDLQAYVIDPDTAGLNVRRGPSVGSESVARIDPGAEVTVIGASGNWLRIRNATIPETGTRSSTAPAGCTRGCWGRRPARADRCRWSPSRARAPGCSAASTPSRR